LLLLLMFNCAWCCDMPDIYTQCFTITFNIKFVHLLYETLRPGPRLLCLLQLTRPSPLSRPSEITTKLEILSYFKRNKIMFKFSLALYVQMFKKNLLIFSKTTRQFQL
jgi:hypothetical protein